MSKVKGEEVVGKLVVEREVTKEVIQAVLEGCYHGSSYWISFLDVPDMKGCEFMTEVVGDGGVWVIYVSKDETGVASDPVPHKKGLRNPEKFDWYVLDLDKVIKGLGLCLAAGHGYGGDPLDPCNIDACVGDNVVQYALFGQLIFS
jgi:hypothetical protein